MRGRLRHRKRDEKECRLQIVDAIREDNQERVGESDSKRWRNDGKLFVRYGKSTSQSI